MRITLLYEPPTGRSTPCTVGLEKYDRLVDELDRFAGAPVSVLESTLREAPSEGYVLFAGNDWSRALADGGRLGADQLASRMVLLDVSAHSALALLEDHRFAGAVDSLRLSEWLARPASCVGPFGHRALAEAVGASCVPLPGHQSEHYCLRESDRHQGMPHLLVEYLRVYDAALHRLKQEMGGGWAVTA